MPRKPPVEERQIILASDHRRRYGAKLAFRVMFPKQIGSLANVTLLISDGTFARIRSNRPKLSEFGAPYELLIEAYPSAAEAELAGRRAAQALLLTALNLDFGVRLEYSDHEPATVFDRTVSTEQALAMEGYSTWAEDIVAAQVVDSFAHAVRDRRMLLSMELLASSMLESNDRARFVMAVSALEPLAVQADLGPEVAEFTTRAIALSRSMERIPSEIRASLEGRIHQLRQESVRQALARLCRSWFPNDPDARAYIDYVYSLRSQILHDGQVADLDVILINETRRARNYIRRIFEVEFGQSFRSPTAA